MHNAAAITDLEWIEAVSQHPNTSDDDLTVAAALVLGDAHRAEDVEGMNPFLVNFSLGRLEVLGFLREAVTLGDETMYELCIPSPA
ncbi:hypothetical protein [Rhodococcus aetherivorans]|uniref:hypothetical protein n=1 Tax=Rhodococcus aetherivorans TaxID=191292 RepID=UPI00241E09AC|nr:hypothetical protein [Rhodococcus aetherivorans]WFS15168.1 hypothetical protein P9K37_09050 [Rhodococcus aetherivorans]